MICVSTADGESLFEHVLTENEIYDGSEFSIPVCEKDLFCFSIINEYQIDTINEGYPFTLARTYYDISTVLTIRKFDHPSFREFYKQHTVLLQIKNVPQLERYIHYSQATISTWKNNKEGIWAQPNCWPGEDLFIVMRGRNDPKYRYIYFDEEDVPIIYSNRPAVSDAYPVDWRFLSTDIHHTEIKLPIPKRMRGSITALNKRTGKKCILFDSKGDTTMLSTEKFDLFIPNNRFSELNADLTWYDKFEYNYRIKHGLELTLPSYEAKLFTPESFILDSLTLKTTLSPFPEYFRIIYVKETLGSDIEIGKKMHHISRSQWFVIGENKKEVKFTLPSISAQSLQKFSSLSEDTSNWWFYKFDNVKVLEDDPKIEWINFFRDYNVLLVSYRDPYK